MMSLKAACLNNVLSWIMNVDQNRYTIKAFKQFPVEEKNWGKWAKATTILLYSVLTKPTFTFNPDAWRQNLSATSCHEVSCQCRTACFTLLKGRRTQSWNWLYNKIGKVWQKVTQLPAGHMENTQLLQANNLHHALLYWLSPLRALVH